MKQRHRGGKRLHGRGAVGQCQIDGSAIKGVLVLWIVRRRKSHRSSVAAQSGDEEDDALEKEMEPHDGWLQSTLFQVTYLWTSRTRRGNQQRQTSEDDMSKSDDDYVEYCNSSCCAIVSQAETRESQLDTSIEQTRINSSRKTTGSAKSETDMNQESIPRIDPPATLARLQ